MGNVKCVNLWFRTETTTHLQSALQMRGQLTATRSLATKREI